MTGRGYDGQQGPCPRHHASCEGHSKKFILVLHTSEISMLMPTSDDPVHENNTLASLTVTESKQPKTSVHDLTRWWGIGLETAKHTITKTTQWGVYST